MGIDLDVYSDLLVPGPSWSASHGVREVRYGVRRCFIASGSQWDLVASDVDRLMEMLVPIRNLLPPFESWQPSGSRFRTDSVLYRLRKEFYSK